MTSFLKRFRIGAFAPVCLASSAWRSRTFVQAFDLGAPAAQAGKGGALSGLVRPPRPSRSVDVSSRGGSEQIQRRLVDCLRGRQLKRIGEAWMAGRRGVWELQREREGRE